MNNIENIMEYPANIFDDVGDGDGDFDYDPNLDMDIDLNLLIQLLDDTINEEHIHVICEITEDVPLKKKPRLHFHYHTIEY